nr:MAG TPA: hypothetical protein [Bacteriophage sp.]
MFTMVTYGAIINIKVEKERFYTWLEKRLGQ